MQRRVKPRVRTFQKVKAESARALTDSERAAILAAVHTKRFADLSVREIYATLLDEGVYLGSISTMYRVLRAARETRERRRLASHSASIKPELSNCTQSSVVVGHHKASWPAEVDVLSPIRRARRLQSIRRRLAA